jgi:hypothetical protein
MKHYRNNQADGMLMPLLRQYPAVKCKLADTKKASSLLCSASHKFAIVFYSSWHILSADLLANCCICQSRFVGQVGFLRATIDF